MKKILASAALAALVTALAACGGGGDNGTEKPAEASVSIAANSISHTGGPTEASFVQSLDIAISNPPAAGTYIKVSSSANGLQAVDVLPVSTTAAQARVTFKPGASLADGTYSDTLQVSVCLDAQCKTHLAGSPLTVNTIYTVTADDTASISSTEIAITALSTNQAIAEASLTITSAGSAPADELHVASSNGNISIVSITATPMSPSQTRVSFNFGKPSLRVPGTYSDTATLRLCYDSACRREVSGSPFQVNTTYTVTPDALPEPGVAPLVVASRSALPHDVIDAEYSASLDALVMVSTWPQNALYVYDLASGTEKQVSLTQAPKAVSISPDGSQAVVGHDALLSHVDLATAGSAATALRLLDLSADAGDVVLDSRGKVFVFPAAGQSVDVHTIDVANNTETLQPGAHAGSRARLHPRGGNLYAADNGLTPDNIENYDITTGQAARLGNSPYLGDPAMCGNLWFSEDGARIFTACGNTFQTSAVRSEDMLFAGALPLSTTGSQGYRIQSLSHFAATSEIALIEHSWYECQPYAYTQTPCASHLSLYDSSSYGLRAVYSIPPVTLDNLNYAQRGLFVFHRRGGGKLLLSRLVGAPTASAEYYLSTIS